MAFKIIRSSSGYHQHSDTTRLATEVTTDSGQSFNRAIVDSQRIYNCLIVKNREQFTAAGILFDSPRENIEKEHVGEDPTACDFKFNGNS